MVSPLVLEQKEDVFGFVRAFESQVGGGIAQSNPCGQEKTRVSEYSLVTGRSRSYLATMSHDKGTVQVRRSSSTGFLGSMKERKRKKKREKIYPTSGMGKEAKTFFSLLPTFFPPQPELLKYITPTISTT
jgi:hypothetical protein